MRKARKQNGSLYLNVNGSKTPVWKFSWWHVLSNGKHVCRKRQVGTLDQYKTEAAAEQAVRSWRLAINSNQVHAFSGITMTDVIEYHSQPVIKKLNTDKRVSGHLSGAPTRHRSRQTART